MPEVLIAPLNKVVNLNKKEERFETPYVTFWMDQEFLCCRYADGLHLSLDVAVFAVESRIFFAKGQSYPLLIDMRGIKSTTRKARQHMATIGATLVKGAALITGSSINRALGNIFLTIDKPEVPIKMFTKEGHARQWLMQYV